MRTLQRLIIPALDVCPEVELYVRLSGAATLDVEDGEIGFRHGGVLRTDTFFGVFSLGRWSEQSTLRRVSVALDLSGAFVLETMVTSLDGAERVWIGARSTRRRRRWVCLNSPTSVRVCSGSD